MTPSPKPRPSEREIAERITQEVAVWFITKDAGSFPLADKIESALQDARRAALEAAAQIAEGSAGPFPKGERIAADGTEATEIARAMQHGLGGGRDAIAAAIRSLPSPSPGGKP